ncbi:MAG: antibiotic biosynthesis monooxygenase [Kiritimatiellia bacterium]|jgi:quinol monooxygenase YgiN|nr:antibiotic biosynthesis monooxygenase [Kiritimatiellia bacterium]
MIISTIRIAAEDEQKNMALLILRGLVARTRATVGCVDCCLCETVLKPQRICFTTRWHDQQALDKYISSPLYGRVLAVIDMASQAPEVSFKRVIETEGMDYIAAKRCNQTVAGTAPGGIALP